MEDLSIKKKKYAAAFLRGLVAADGSVTLCQYKTIKSLSAVELALETEHERILYSNVMKKLDLDVKDYSASNRKLCVCGWDDFLKLALFDILKLHEKKNEDFRKGFQNSKQTKMIKKYLSPLLKEKLSTNELKDKLHLKSKGSLVQTLQIQIKRGFVKRTKIKREYKYYLTKYGKKTLEFLLNY